MSFNVTVYVHNNPEIAKTSWKAVDDNRTYYLAYGEYDSEGGTVEVSSGNVKFEAEPEDGYVFKQWVYRVGSITADVQYSTKNPFTYKEEQDIFIRAEGEELTYEYIDTLSDLTDLTSLELTINEDEYKYIEFSCKYSGKVKIYSEGDIDTIGYITNSDSFFDGNILAENDDVDEENEDYNFLLEYDVEAGTIYYLWIRTYDNGDTVIVFEPPSEPGTAIGGGGLYIYTSIGTPDNNPYSRWVKVTPYILTSRNGYKNWELAQSNVLTSIGGWTHWISDDS